MLNFQLDENKDDFSRVRTIETDTNVYYFEREDPYGFIKIKSKIGKLPAALGGQFTSFDEAIKVFTLHMNNKKK